MKKKIFSLLVLLVAAVSGAWAQTQITITQGFEDGMGDWTTNHCHNITGISSSYGGYEGSHNFRFYYSSAVPQYLISPELDENDGGTMSFYCARYSGSYAESFKVGYSTTTSEPSAFTWGNEQTVLDIYSSGYSNFTYDFPAGTKYVSIACTSNDQFYLFVDAINIEYAAAEAPTGSFALTKAEDAEAHGTVKFNVGEDETLKENVSSAKEGDKVTVVITPAEGWCTKEVTARGYVGWEVASSRQRVPMTLLDDLTVTGEGNAWTFDMPAANALVNVSYKKLLTNQDILVVDIDDVTYNGQYLTPEVTVKDGNTVLTKDVDYSLSYADNKNAGTATVTITGIGEKYAGEITKQFTIDKANAFVEFDPNTYVKTYGDEPFTLNATIIGDGFYYYYGSSISEIVISDKNEEYYDEKFYGVVDVDSQTGEVTIVGPGRAYVYLSMLEGDNYYPSTVTICRIDVLPKDASTLTVAQAEGEVLTDADAKAPTLTVKDGDKELVEGKDYTISYADAEGNALEEMPTAAGTYNVVVTFTGFYGGTKSVTYTIAESGTTAVYDLNDKSEMINDNCYDLNGRKVNGQLKKGVYIINGRKVVIK